MINYFLFVVLILNSLQLMAASFDCADSKYPDEVAVCNDEVLSRLDVKLSELYKGLENRINIKSDQVAWIKEKRKCFGDVECLQQHYALRIRVLRGLSELSDVDLEVCGYFKKVFNDAKKVCISNAEECLDLQVGNSAEFKNGVVKAYPMLRNPLVGKNSVVFSDDNGESKYLFYEKFNGMKTMNTTETWIVPIDKLELVSGREHSNLQEVGYKVADSLVMLYKIFERHYSAVGGYKIKREYGGGYKTKGMDFLEIKKVYTNREPESICVFGG